MNFADKIIRFYRNTPMNGSLPDGVNVMLPFADPVAGSIAESFYKKFYSDNRKRIFIIGINPGRFGGGVTGIPFTDPLKLEKHCGIPNSFGKKAELSADFIYQVIEAYGGCDKFYKRFYFTAVSPWGFTKDGLNLNYYDDKKLLGLLDEFLPGIMQKQLDFGAEGDHCICLGKGKNQKCLTEMNNRYGFFKNIIPLDHPRFIMQYRRKKVNDYIEIYLNALHASNE